MSLCQLFYSTISIDSVKTATNYKKKNFDLTRQVSDSTISIELICVLFEYFSLRDALFCDIL